MKFLWALSLICAGVFANDWNSDENQFQASRAPLVLSKNNSEDQVFDEDKEDASIPRRNLMNDSYNSRRHSSYQPQQTEQYDRQNLSNNSPLSGWASYPEAASFEAKIQARLSSSRVLSSKPEEREKLKEIAENKFKTCKGLPEDKERPCLGRVTGQIMQLVSAVENINRNPA